MTDSAEPKRGPLGRFPTPIKPTGRHLIKEVDYSEDYIECECGWNGPVEEFQPHRKTVIVGRHRR